MNLTGRRLAGAIRSELGQLRRLWGLCLYGNRLPGPISAELDQPGSLKSLYVGDYPATERNRFTGCIPRALQEIPSSNLDSLGLPVCESAERVQ